MCDDHQLEDLSSIEKLNGSRYFVGIIRIECSSDGSRKGNMGDGELTKCFFRLHHTERKKVALMKLEINCTWKPGRK